MKKKLRFLFTAALLIVCSLGSAIQAQSSYVEIAPNNLATDGIDGRPKYRQMIYTKAEMGNQACQIYGIELSRESIDINHDTVMLFDIYMSETLPATKW